jgi:hypothetical protein
MMIVKTVSAVVKINDVITHPIFSQLKEEAFILSPTSEMLVAGFRRCSLSNGLVIVESKKLRMESS